MAEERGHPGNEAAIILAHASGARYALTGEAQNN
jgi:hypothetical protein